MFCLIVPLVSGALFCSIFCLIVTLVSRAQFCSLLFSSIAHWHTVLLCVLLDWCVSISRFGLLCVLFDRYGSDWHIVLFCVVFDCSVSISRSVCSVLVNVEIALLPLWFSECLSIIFCNSKEFTACFFFFQVWSSHPLLYFYDYWWRGLSTCSCCT